MASLLDLESQEIADGRDTCLLLEERREVRGRVFEIGGELLECQVVLCVLLHIMDNLAGEGLALVREGLDRPELLKAGEGGQELIETHGRVKHIFPDIGHRETVVDLLEEAQPVLQSRVVVGRDWAWVRIGRFEMVAHPSPEMDPIDSPRILVVGTERVGRSGRDDQVMVLVHRIGDTTNLIPAFARRAIDEHGIVASPLFQHIMIFYVREIADLSDIKITDDRIFSIFLQLVFRKRDKAFALESLLNFRHNSQS